MTTRKPCPYYFRAFTLIEMLVTISIMTLILGITLSGGPQALTKLSLTEVTYSAELLIREAQLQGSAINSLNGQLGGAGVYFSLASPTAITKFKDIVDPSIVRSIGIGNGLYNTSPVDELDVRQVILNKHKISKLCITTGTTTFQCNDQAIPAIQNLTISYTRPSQTAHIYVNNSTTTSYSAACVQIDSIRAPLPGYLRSIMIYRSGMITKKAGPCTTP